MKEKKRIYFLYLKIAQWNLRINISVPFLERLFFFAFFRIRNLSGKIKGGCPKTPAIIFVIYQFK